MFPFTVGKYIYLTFCTLKMHLISEMQNKANFILQIFGMFFNDFSLTLIWIIFFKQFPSINGWQFEDSALLIGISWSGFFIFNLFARGILELNQIIISGQLDQYLLLPKSIIWQVATSKCGFWEIGSFIVSTFMFYLSGYVTLIKLPLLILLILISTTITFNFLLILGTLSFYFGNMEFIAEKLTRTLFDLTYYPQSVFNGILKFIMIFIIPAYFVGSIPMNLMKNFNILPFVGLITFTIFYTILAYWIFKNGLKRYESGNLISTKS